MRIKLHWQILIALGFAAVAGMLTAQLSDVVAERVVAVYTFVGTLFLNALKMLIVPLILSSIISGIAGVGKTGALGRLGGKTLIYYLSTSLIAILLGLLLVNMIQPGLDNGVPVKPPEDRAAVASSLERIEGTGIGDVAEVFLRMIPANVVSAAAQGQMLGLIFFSLLFGYYLTRIPANYGEHLLDFWQGVFEVMMKITDLVMMFAPIGVFALVAKVVATTGFREFASVGWFFVTVVLALTIHAGVVMPLLLSVLGRVNPMRHFRAMASALLTAFSTASSSATLPITMECVEKNVGVSNRTTSFVLPLGATINMDGTALYECVAAMFIAQAYGMELSFGIQFTVVMVALLTSIGVAGIPSASLVAITIILGAIGLPLEAIGLILVVDRVLDMFRTSVNVFSDSCGAVIMARLEGEEGMLESPADKGSRHG